MKLVWMVAVVLGLVSCKEFSIADSSDHYATGTANEPGTAVNPSQGVDLYEKINEEQYDALKKQDQSLEQETLEQESL